jgi:hypothetical protein
MLNVIMLSVGAPNKGLLLKHYLIQLTLGFIKNNAKILLS